jgi:hypothetical protein
MPLTTIAEYATTKGCSRALIYKLEKQKRIKFKKRKGKKLIDSDEVDKVLVNSESGKINGAKRKPSTVNNKKAEQTIPEVKDVKKTSGKKLSRGLNYNEIEKIRLYEQARKLEIDNQTKLGLLVNKKERDEQEFTENRKVRDALLTIPARVVGLIQGKTIHEQELIINEEIKLALTNLSEEFENG